MQCEFPASPVDALDVVAIAAHPDDVEQTCGGTLIKMAERGYRTGVLDLTAGEMGSRGNPELRIEESQRAAAELMLAWRGNLRLPDARLENNVAARMSLAVQIRVLRPRVVILPYWQARHPDHYRAGELGYEACFLAGLRKLESQIPPHRPHKILYASLYANVTPSFVVDITPQFVPLARRDPRAPGIDCAFLRQSDRRALRRALRGQGNAGSRRRGGFRRAQLLIAQAA